MQHILHACILAGWTRNEGHKGCTLKMLEGPRRKLGAQTLDEAIRLFITQRGRERPREAFGMDEGGIKPFINKGRPRRK